MSNKHDANVRKSTLVNFQIGLIASLLFSYLMFEVYTTEQVVYHPRKPESTTTEPDVWDGRFIEYQAPKEKVVAVKHTKQVADPQKFEIIDNSKVIKKAEDEFKSVLPVETKAPDVTSIDNIEPDEGPEEVPFILVEFVPIFPGCEKLETNRERASCFSDKIQRIVARKFDTGLGQELGLSGLQRIHVQFDVYKDGTIKNIMTRAPHPLLEKEAKRVVQSFPRMTPGKQRDRAVTVKYQLPIAFKIEN